MIAYTVDDEHQNNLLNFNHHMLKEFLDEYMVERWTLIIIDIYLHQMIEKNFQEEIRV